MNRFIFLLFVGLGGNALAQTAADSAFLKEKTDAAYDALSVNLDSARTLAMEARELAREKGVFKYEMDAHAAIGWSYFDNYEFDKALQYFLDGLEQSKEKGDVLTTGNFFNNIAMTYERTAEYQSAVNYYRRSLSMYEQVNDSSGIPIAYGNLSNAYTSLGNLDSAIICQKKAIAIREAQKSPKIHSNYSNIGTCYHYLGRFDLALEYYLKSANLRREQGEFILEAYTYSNLASLFTDLRDHKNSIKYAELSMEIFQRESREDLIGNILSNMGSEYKRVRNYQRALDCYNQSLELNRKTKSEDEIAISLHNIGSIYEELGELDKALSYYREALVIKEQIDVASSAVITRIAIGNLLSLTNRPDSALILLKAGNEQAIELGLLDRQRTAAEKLADHYERFGDYKLAASLRKIESALKDSIYNEDYTSKMNQLFVSFESERTKNELLNEQLKTQLLEKDKATAELEAAKKDEQLKLLIGASFLLLLVGGFLFYRSKQTQKNKLAQIRIEEQQKGLSAVIQVQEEERKRIAKDLHDGIVQQLGGLKLGLQKVFSGNETKDTEKLIKVLDDSATELRELSHQMMPRSLNELGLIPALNDMLENSLGHSEVAFQFEHFGIHQRFSEKVEIAIYRIAQELVNNVIKHSQASKVNVQLFKTGKDLLLMIEDNGKGMRSDQQKDGIGLMNISSRLDTINGKVNFEPSSESGTLATVKIPVSDD